jgi:N6-adenosine-specific RNA methylase IME4
MTDGYRTIVADPPWAYPSPGGHLRSSAAHRPNSHNQGASALGASSGGRYGSMSLDELEALDVAAIAAEDAHLYLWTTNAFIAEAHGLCRAWGFRPITVLTWGKVKPDGSPSMKLGHYFRGATEHVVFGVRGSLGLSTNRALPTLMLWPRTSGHSVKPDQFFELVEEASPGPYCELFCRNPRLGWDSWGGQILSDFDLATSREPTP